jgi:hypothetical protein
MVVVENLYYKKHLRTMYAIIILLGSSVSLCLVSSFFKVPFRNQICSISAIMIIITYGSVMLYFIFLVSIPKNFEITASGLRLNFVMQKKKSFIPSYIPWSDVQSIKKAKLHLTESKKDPTLDHSLELEFRTGIKALQVHNIHHQLIIQAYENWKRNAPINIEDSLEKQDRLKLESFDSNGLLIGTIIEPDESYRDRKLQSGFLFTSTLILIGLILSMFFLGIYYAIINVPDGYIMIIVPIFFFVLTTVINRLFPTHFMKDILIQRVIIDKDGFTPSDRPPTYWLTGKSFRISFSNIIRGERLNAAPLWKYHRTWLTRLYLKTGDFAQIHYDVNPSVHIQMTQILEMRKIPFKIDDTILKK